MDTTKETPQFKSRQTKLSKKTHEELVNLVLKKDKIERNLNNQIHNLKSEINGLNSRITGFVKDSDGDSKKIKSLRELVNTRNEQLDSIRMQLVETKELLDNSEKTIVEQNKEYNSLKQLTWTLAGFAFLCILWILV